MTATVIVREVKRYQCSICRRSWSSRKRAEEHAVSCIHDPATRSCPTCTHDDHGEPEVGVGAGCAIGARPADVTCIRSCDQWEQRTRLWP